MIVFVLIQIYTYIDDTGIMCKAKTGSNSSIFGLEPPISFMETASGRPPRSLWLFLGGLASLLGTFSRRRGCHVFCRFSVSDCCWCNGRIYHPSKQKHIIFVRWYMPSDGGSSGGSKQTWRWIANEWKTSMLAVKNSRVECGCIF